VFRPRFALLTQLEWLVSSPRRLGAAAALAVVTAGVVTLLDPTPDDPGFVMGRAFPVILGVLTVAAIPALWLAHRRLGELHFDAAQRLIVRRAGRTIERVPFSRVEGVYCVRDQWTGVEEEGVPVGVYEVSVRVADDRIVLARCGSREEAEDLRECVTALLTS